MALKDFDIAFTSKIKAWFSNTIYANTAIVYNVAYNLVDDASTVLKFPLISIYRPSGFSPADAQNFSARKRGIEYYYNEETKKSILARFITVNLAYQLDIYAKTPEMLDDITENIMQALNLDQGILITQHDVKNDQDYIEQYDITYTTGPAELSEFQNDDRVYHYSIVYSILNARILNFRASDTIISTEVDIDHEGGTLFSGTTQENPGGDFYE